MTAYAERIRTLRAKTGRSAAELSALAGLSDMEYFDLELHDDELLSVPSLAQVRRLSAALGVPSSTLVCEDGFASPARRIDYPALVQRARAYMSEVGLSQEQLENQVGWSLDAFFESEQQMLESYNLDFLKALCTGVGVPWQEAIP